MARNSAKSSKRTTARSGKSEMKKEKGQGTTRFFDYNLLFIIIFMLCFGLVMLYSTSSYTAANKFGDGAFYLKKQLKATLLGIGVMIFFTLVDYRFWKKFGFFAYIVALGLCLLVFAPGIGSSQNGSSRWLSIGPLSLQPSEVAKIAVILFLAVVIEKIPTKLNSTEGVIKTFAMVVPIMAVVAYSNLSTGIIIAGIAMCMLFISSTTYRPFLVLGGIGVAGVVGLITTQGYRMDRINAWLHPENAGKHGFQTLQGLYAIGSGGLFGKGLGESIQKMGFVPEAQNDMIFTIICEELGLFGGVCVILLFGIMLWRMMIIANNASDLFGSLLVIGVMAHIALQVILNVAVVTNSMPNTGVTLPFISYGGTSIVFLLSEMGLVLSVSRGIRLQKIDS